MKNSKGVKAYTNQKKLTNTLLNPRQLDFCTYYVELGNTTQAAIKAGYSKKTADVQGARLLRDVRVQNQIRQLREPLEKESIMTAQEVMEHFTAIARGEEKDQFGIEISASDRIKALVELAKRTVDIDNRAAGKADANVEIKLDWSR